MIYTSDNGPWNQSAYYENKEGHPEGSIFWGEAGPLRNGEGSFYEGGLRVPGIVRWPGKVPADRVSDAIVATIDFLPTFARLTGFEVPADRVIDGIDQTDLLLGKTKEGRDNFVYGRAGVRQGKWKFLKAKHGELSYAKDETREEVVELYDLDADIGEQNNLAERFPEKVRELEKLTNVIIQAEELPGQGR